MKILFEWIGAKHGSNLSHWAYPLMALIKVRGRLQKIFYHKQVLHNMQAMFGLQGNWKDMILLCRVACNALNACNEAWHHTWKLVTGIKFILDFVRLGFHMCTTSYEFIFLQEVTLEIVYLVEWDWVTRRDIMSFCEVLLFSLMYHVLTYDIWDILLV